MSDPQHSSDVEDVLSSIRRLVSEEKRPQAEPEPEPVPDRLVLTPALRVAAPDEDAAQEPHEPEIAAADPAPAEDMHDSAAQDDVEDTVPDLDLASDAVELDAHETFEPPAVPEAAVEPDIFEAADDEPEEAAGVTEPAQEDLASDPQDTDAQQTYTSPQSLSAKIAALEEVISRRNDQWEPDDVGADAYAGTDDGHMEWEDAAPDVTPGHGATLDEGPELFDADEDVLDEDALRDLVADIVREELQGALGERITRNVRKLVRREIHRALAAQDLD